MTTPNLVNPTLINWLAKRWILTTPNPNSNLVGGDLFVPSNSVIRVSSIQARFTGSSGAATFDVLIANTGSGLWYVAKSLQISVGNGAELIQHPIYLGETERLAAVLNSGTSIQIIVNYEVLA